MTSSDGPGYLYILQPREFLRSGESVYKIGRSINVEKRSKSYPKGSLLLFCMYVSEQKRAESELIRQLCETCEQCLQFWREYFKGEFEHVLEVMLSICRSYRKLDVKSEEGDVDSSKASKVLANVIQEVSEQIGQEVEQGSRTTCERCGVTFASTHSLIRHLKAIKPCPITISNNSRETIVSKLAQPRRKKAPTSFPCEFCGNMYTDRNNCYRHKKKCTKNPKNMPRDLVIEALVKQISSLTKNLNEVRESTPEPV